MDSGGAHGSAHLSPLRLAPQVSLKDDKFVHTHPTMLKQAHSRLLVGRTASVFEWSMKRIHSSLVRYATFFDRSAPFSGDNVCGLGSTAQLILARRKDAPTLPPTERGVRDKAMRRMPRLDSTMTRACRVSSAHVVPLPRDVVWTHSIVQPSRLVP